MESENGASWESRDMDPSPQGEHWAMRIKPKLPDVRSRVWLEALVCHSLHSNIRIVNAAFNLVVTDERDLLDESVMCRFLLKWRFLVGEVHFCNELRTSEAPGAGSGIVEPAINFEDCAARVIRIEGGAPSRVHRVRLPCANQRALV